MTKIYYSVDKKGIFNDPFFQQINLLYKDAFSLDSKFRPFCESSKPVYPMNAWFNDEHYVFEFAIVKGKIEDVEITKTGDTLKIKYTRSNKDEAENSTYIKRGISQRDFDYEWKIPSKLDKDKIRSTFEGGLLSIYIPFVAEVPPEKIDILNVDGNRKITDKNQSL